MLNLVVNRDKIKETYLSANDTEFKIIFNSSDWYRMHKKAIFLVGDNSYIVEGLENNRIYSLPEECAGTEFSVYIVGESSNSYKSTERQLIRILGGEVSNLEVQAAVEKYLERNSISGMTEEQSIQLSKIPQLENTIKDLEKQTGVGIQSISKTATNGLIDTYTITFTDNTTTTFQIKNGEKGDKGEQGEKGDKGDAGEQGIQGIQGVAGQDGKDGITYTPTIGSVTTLQPNENASASVNINEENLTASFNFLIPKGEKGDKGEQGIAGKDGFVHEGAIANDLETTKEGFALDARQGKVLDSKIAEIGKYEQFAVHKSESMTTYKLPHNLKEYRFLYVIFYADAQMMICNSIIIPVEFFIQSTSFQWLVGYCYTEGWGEVLYVSDDEINIKINKAVLADAIFVYGIR